MVVGVEVEVEVEGDSRPSGPPGPSSQLRQRQEAAMRDATSNICHQWGCQRAQCSTSVRVGWLAQP